MENKKLKEEKLFMRLAKDNEFLFDFCLSYGIVLIMMIAVLLINGFQNLFVIILDCFVPTTIAFSGTIVIQKTPKEIKLASPFLLLAMISLAVMYIVFVAVNAITTITSDSGSTLCQAQTNIIWFFVICLMVWCVYLSKYFYPEHIPDDKRQNDGSIAG